MGSFSPTEAQGIKAGMDEAYARLLQVSDI